jgi:hypothetical protein
MLMRRDRPYPAGAARVPLYRLGIGASIGPDGHFCGLAEKLRVVGIRGLQAPQCAGSPAPAFEAFGGHQRTAFSHCPADPTKPLYIVILFEIRTLRPYRYYYINIFLMGYNYFDLSACHIK